MNVVSPYRSSQSSVGSRSSLDSQTLFRMLFASFPFICAGITVAAYESVLFFVAKLQITSWNRLFLGKISAFQTLQTAESFLQSSLFTEVFYGLIAGLLITLLRFVYFRFNSPHTMTTIPESFLSAIFCKEFFTQGWKFLPLLFLNTALGILTSTAISTIGGTNPLMNNATPFAQLALGVTNGGGAGGIPSLSVLSLILILFFTVILLGIIVSLVLHVVIAWPIILLSSLREATTSAVSEIYAGRSQGALGKRLLSALGEGAISGAFSGMIVGAFQSVAITVALSASTGLMDAVFLVLIITWSGYIIFNAYMHPRKIELAFKEFFEFIGNVFAVIFGLVLYFGIGGAIIYWLNSC